MRAAKLVLLIAMLWSVPARADGGAFGLGLIIGQPTGVTAAFELSDHTMIDAAIGFGWVRDRDFYTHVEFDYFLPTLVKGGSAELSAYLGIGGFFFAHKDPGFGARAPFGLSVDFTSVPLQIFGEVALLLAFTPDTDLDVRGAVGFRYYF
jgi:hypothetical protein